LQGHFHTALAAQFLKFRRGREGAEDERFFNSAFNKIAATRPLFEPGE
jgi:hypothetical protein